MSLHRPADYNPPIRGHRNVSVLAVSLFGLALGEELWQAYMPAYLAALGASGLVIGLFSSTRDLLDGLYQYPGGWLADRFGRRTALLGFTSLAIAGYALYSTAGNWAWMFAGLFGVMWWKAGAFPTTFAVIGDSLPPGRRALAFGVQSVLVRVPRVVAAPLGGLLIASLGIIAGIRAAFVITIALGLAVLAVQFFAFHDDPPAAGRASVTSARGVFSAMPRRLKHLLLADCLVRIGEGIALAFIVLYALRTVSPAQYGLLYAIQQTVAIVSYLPGGRIGDAAGRKPVVALTFLFFAVFPLAVRLASGWPSLIGAFLIGGLKEIGEPARKAMIVDLAPEGQRAATVGVYYAIRNVLVFPAGLTGGWLWQIRPGLPLEVAFAVGMVAVVIFWATSRERAILQS